MQYRDLERRYDSEPEIEELYSESLAQQTATKQFRQRRPARTTRRRVPKNEHPGYGISARRNRRWSW